MSRHTKKRRAPGLVSGSELRRRLDVSERTWERWVAEGMPQAERGRGARPSLFDAIAVAKWVRDRDEEAIAHGGPQSEHLEKLRREKWIDARRRNRIADGELVERAEVLRVIAECIAMMRTQLEAFERLRGREVGDDLRAWLDRALFELRRRLAPHQEQKRQS